MGSRFNGIDGLFLSMIHCKCSMFHEGMCLSLQIFYPIGVSPSSLDMRWGPSLLGFSILTLGSLGERKILLSTKSPIRNDIFFSFAS